MSIRAQRLSAKAAQTQDLCTTQNTTQARFLIGPSPCVTPPHHSRLPDELPAPLQHGFILRIPDKILMNDSCWQRAAPAERSPPLPPHTHTKPAPGVVVTTHKNGCSGPRLSFSFHSFSVWFCLFTKGLQNESVLFNRTKPRGPLSIQRHLGPLHHGAGPSPSHRPSVHSLSALPRPCPLRRCPSPCRGVK